MDITIGMKHSEETVVVYENTAAALGSGAAEVFSTPSMIALMECAASNCVRPCLEEGQSTVGTSISITHDAAVPIGFRVWAEAELIEIDRKALTFKVAAYSDVEKIGEGIHKRFIINEAKFFSKLGDKYKK